MTPRVSKHRIFAWVAPETTPDSAIVAIAYDDDYTFGVLHSRYHEVWARATGTQLREAESGFRYSHTATFETFPFPRTTSDQRKTISDAASELNSLREGWLNPKDMSGKPMLGSIQLGKRTLTNLYNKLPTWLRNAHATLNKAVAEAYGSRPDLTDEQILELLLDLNLARAEGTST